MNQYGIKGHSNMTLVNCFDSRVFIEVFFVQKLNYNFDLLFSPLIVYNLLTINVCFA